jgi:hypothetical protein
MSAGESKPKKRVLVSYGVDIDAIAGWLGSYKGEDSTSDISRGMFFEKRITAIAFNKEIPDQVAPDDEWLTSTSHHRRLFCRHARGQKVVETVRQVQDQGLVVHSGPQPGVSLCTPHKKGEIIGDITNLTWRRQDVPRRMCDDP